MDAYNDYSGNTAQKGFSNNAQGARVDTPSGLTGSQGYMNRLLAYRQTDVDRDNMIQELISRYEILESKHHKTLDDYNNEIESRRMWQNKVSNLQKDLTAIKQTTESNPFVYAIIDGDGAIFDEQLLLKGADGGAEAAYMLREQIKTYIKEVYPDANIEDWSIVVQVILNLEGLTKKLHAAGIVPNTSDSLASFGRAFGRSQPLFSFVDVGAGKESADHKIREMMRLMMRVSQCKHVFFGPCHDNGYLPALEPYKRDTTVAPRLTLLETTRAEPGFLQLGFKKANFPSVFRSEPLPARPGIYQPPQQRSSYHGYNSSAPQQPPQQKTLPVRSPEPMPAPTTAAVPPPKIANAAAATALSSPSSTSASLSGGTGGSWSAISKNPSSGAHTIDIGVKKKGQRKYYLLNADSERLDENLPRPDPASEKKFKELMQEYGNFCNNFYLLGGCESGSVCDYHHGDKLSPGMLLVLKHKVRGIKCPQQSYCTNPDCVYAHHCKWPSDCTLNWCRFENTHDMDLTPRLRVFEDGSTQSMTDRQ